MNTINNILCNIWSTGFSTDVWSFKFVTINTAGCLVRSISASCAELFNFPEVEIANLRC